MITTTAIPITTPTTTPTTKRMRNKINDDIEDSSSKNVTSEFGSLISLRTTTSQLPLKRFPNFFSISATTNLKKKKKCMRICLKSKNKLTAVIGKKWNLKDLISTKCTIVGIIATIIVIVNSRIIKSENPTLLLQYFQIKNIKSSNTNTTNTISQTQNPKPKKKKK